jgi:hypothetical protein
VLKSGSEIKGAALFRFELVLSTDMGLFASIFGVFISLD